MDTVNKLLNINEPLDLDLSLIKNCPTKSEDIILKIQPLGIQDHRWLLLAGRLEMYEILKWVPLTFSEYVNIMKEYLDKDFCEYVSKHATVLNNAIKPDRDFCFDLLAVHTLKKSYLTKNFKLRRIIESPQYMYMRVAVFLYMQKDTITTRSNNRDYNEICYDTIFGYEDENYGINGVISVYNSLSMHEISHASPTLFNAGKINGQMSSCFTMTIDDTLEDIARNWSECGLISKNSGGLGIDYSRLRHSEIKKNMVNTKGIIQWVKITDNILSTVDQGGKRKGAGVAYLADWHIDIDNFIDLKKGNGLEDFRARNIFTGLVVSDLFMNRVKNDEEWTLFCPNLAKGLVNKWGLEFELLYRKYEKNGTVLNCKKIKARDLMYKIITSQLETGMPYIVYKDAINRKSNQKNLGTITLSNLCSEINIYTDRDNTGTCNLGSIPLHKCISKSLKFDFAVLSTRVRMLVRNLNRVIDRNYNCIDSTKKANFLNRPIGIGIMGLADTFAILKLSWHSQEAKDLNKQIMETMYFVALTESYNIAKINMPYKNYVGSPLEHGQFQFTLWDNENNVINPIDIDPKWNALTKSIKKHGVYNSLLLSLMPTASTANIIGCNECFEPFMYNIYSRTLLSGQFLVVNKYLMDDLIKINMLNTETIKEIIKQDGSVQTLNIPKELKELYLTIYELPQKLMIDYAADRGRFICQSQSLSCYMKDATPDKLNAFHFYGWSRKLKTGMYYLRQKVSTTPTNATADNLYFSCNACSA